MKNLLLLFVLTIFIQINLLAQSENEYYTKILSTNFENGRMWKSYSKYEKETFIVAVFEGINVFQWSLNGEFTDDKKILDKIDEIKKENFGINRYYPSEIVTIIDNFYTNILNIRIPIIYSITYCAKSISGESKEHLENYVESLRKIVNK